MVICIGLICLSILIVFWVVSLLPDSNPRIKGYGDNFTVLNPPTVPRPAEPPKPMFPDKDEGLHKAMLHKERQ